MKHIPKWGFGMAPLKKSTNDENRKALEYVRDFVLKKNTLYSANLLNDLSRVKGIFNRIIKQNQWDWFTVYMYLDYPPFDDVSRIVSTLSILRNAIINEDKNLIQKSLMQLHKNRFIIYCNNYLEFDINSETSSEYLYILSRREEKDVLKIGMTTRNVQKRVNEINSATGVIYPLSARKVFKVKNSKLVEKEIHKILSEYRMRADREFFKIDYTKACKIINEYLTRNHLYFYE